MPKKVVKTTSKGQITLPKKWRSQFDTDTFILDAQGETLIIKALDLSKEESNLDGEEVVWDADRDNNGKGIPVSEMIKLLKEVRNG